MRNKRFIYHIYLPFKMCFYEKVLIFGLLLLVAISMDAQTVTYAYDAAGNRTARVVTLPAVAKSPAATQSSKATTALDDMVAEKKIVIYPNPTKGIVKVEITGYTDDTKASFRLMSMSGQIIITRTADSSSQTFDLSSQAAGIYLLQITIDDESVVWKIIKE
jgi:hypothetical protein